ncbi:bifunctional tRNA (5-methylaminomethyl-2-thiouridine)(34)-methyltransferase MnmD/FAD-dependent 5-carboxymethylaminomethyl-2-thiouridine(34) oxidoreductase MnmC [Aliidiomarina haloalkalitolerans]|uniref:tRNA 5-methylaminomethyl-2-thiouridine biosynthesis bifunctional protein MnmC n=1 Tax=Aliidiomarina haloalkalitolerans TaxID=859059 RepID=A0A432VQV3_9GAMM|nr:bifunctional tRNA (5-methylaminomethyl-2-thiouridine)(34)-methyltransferase MnmD/FAD-dependent 5-carboxymethylaminomethyl-2-thiouridine(34) oxidoreductase MnmC [Aliidiomarina haloalkalitolerans]RUO18638.1 bifunctional tRNA (5-methylaminomethyl-2-thiouridine)(34)-methyltransferase MnmD/FAD-dependent 5-carboxymethylaminomethyl-2-thiouridine(34) oxidoreductase MnmC [Aliidiomarina haloalkalitolerans]
MSGSSATSPAISFASVQFDAQGVPESTHYDDIYFSRDDGVAESKYVFLQQNGLPERWQNLKPGQVFHIAETGFGTGLNFLLTAAAFLHALALQKAPAANATACNKKAPAANALALQMLHYTSFEKSPLRRQDLERALSHWAHIPELRELSATLLRHYPMQLSGQHRLHLHPNITLDLIFADVLTALPDWAANHADSVDAWYLDGFAPSKNPDMWQPELYRGIARSMRAGATLATFTATGHVRRGLQQAGIHMQKVPGFGSKREMLRGYQQKLAQPQSRNPFLKQSASSRPQTLCIIGDGIAAASLLWALRDYPGNITLLQPSQGWATGASGNPQGAVYPLLQANWTRTSEFYSHAFLYAQRLYTELAPQAVNFSGVLELATGSDANRRIRKLLALGAYPQTLVQGATQQQASTIAGIALPAPALYYPNAGWVQPTELVASIAEQALAYRQQHGLTTEVKSATQVVAIEKTALLWTVTNTTGSSDAFNQLVLANGAQLADLLPQATIPIRPVRGQITQLNVEPNSELAQLRTVVCHKGYITPATKTGDQATLCIGATFDKTRSSNDYIAADDDANLQQLCDELGYTVDASAIAASRASVRATTPDHLPVIGQVPWVRTRYNAESVAENVAETYTNLWVLSGLGARGFTSAPLCAEALASQIMQRPNPLSASLAAALAADRFVQKAILRKQDPLSLR